MEDDRYTRITLRIPRELHARLQSAADKQSHSQNAEIVATLERSVEGLTGGKPVPLPVFETRITDKIVHPVPITEPVEDGLPLENGNGSDAAN